MGVEHPNPPSVRHCSTEKKMFLSCQTSVLDFFKSLSDTRTSPPAPLDTEDDDPYDTTTVQADASLFWTVIGLSVFTLSVRFS